MHISVENLGPLSKAEFDLKPLTVFIGDNRRGKTKYITLTTSLLDDCGYLAFVNKYISELHP
jgi:predicted ATPase